MLITSQVLICKGCGKQYRLGHLDVYGIARLLKANGNGVEILNSITKELDKRYNEIITNIKSKGEEIGGLDRLIKEDNRGIVKFFKAVYTGVGDPEETFYAMETSPRDTTADFILFLLDGEDKVCSMSCAKILTKEPKVDKKTTVDFTKIYHVTEVRLDDKSRKKMADKIQTAYETNKLNTLIYNQRLGQYVPLLFSNNKPYHLVTLYDKGVYLNITPYAVWFTDEKTQATKVIFNNVYEHHKSSMQRIEEMGQEHPHTNAFDIAYKIFNGRKPVDILTK